MLKFKQPHLREQFEQSSHVLKFITYDFDFLSSKFRKDPMITRVWDVVEGESGVHPDKRALDIRDEFNNEYYYSEEEVKALINYINARWQRNDGFKTCLYHSFNEGPKHFHLQIPVSTKTFELKQLNEP